MGVYWQYWGTRGAVTWGRLRLWGTPGVTDGVDVGTEVGANWVGGPRFSVTSCVEIPPLGLRADDTRGNGDVRGYLWGVLPCSPSDAEETVDPEIGPDPETWPPPETEVLPQSEGGMVYLAAGGRAP